MTQLFTNNAISLLENPISTTDLVINVIPGDGILFPQPTNAGDFFLVTLEDQHAQTREIVKIVARTGDSLFIDPAGRGFEGTPIQAWPADTLVDHRLTAYSLSRIDQLKGSVTDPLTQNVVAANDVKIGDTFTTQYPNNLACKWIVTVLDQSTNRISVCELLAAYKGPTLTPAFTVFARTGDKLKYVVDVQTAGQDMNLIVQNTDTVDLLINCIRLNY